jgi:DASH complex subunit DAD1
VSQSFEHVLANINKLNRSLEAVITVGNEFSSVEALWSQFEGVMGKNEDAGKQGDANQQQQQHEERQQQREDQQSNNS